MQDAAFEEAYCAIIARPSEITSIAFDAASNHLAAANRKGVIQLYTVGPFMGLVNLWSISLGDEIPKVVAFGPTGTRGRDLLAFGLHHGNM